MDDHIRLLVYLIVGFVVLERVVVIVNRLFFHPLASYPGPWLAKVTSLYGAWHSYRGDIHIDMWRCHEKYGDVVRYGPNRLLFRTNKALQEIYGFGKNVQKAAAYHQFPTRFAYSTHNAVEKSMHTRKRKLVKQAFSAQGMQIWVRAVLRQVNILCSELGSGSRLADGHHVWAPVKNMSDYCLYLMSDIVSDAVFQDSFETLTSARNRHILCLVHRTYEWIGIIFQAPKIAQLGLDSYLIRGLAQDRQRLRSIFGGLFRDRIAAKPEEPDILSVYLDFAAQANRDPFSLDELGAEALLLFGAGPDATSTSLASAFFYLVRNATAYQRLCEEIRSNFDGIDEIVPGAALDACIYLRASLNEAMRMNPVNGGALWREVMQGGAIVDGVAVPAGVDVGVGIYSIHHQEEYFPQPYKYTPERWIVNDGNTAASIRLAQSAWAPFSIGPRGCVGKAAAMMQLTVALARILYLYDVRTALDPALAKIGQGVPGKSFPRNLEDEFQAKGTFSSLLHGPMVQFKLRDI